MEREITETTEKPKQGDCLSDWISADVLRGFASMKRRRKRKEYFAGMIVGCGLIITGAILLAIAFSDLFFGTVPKIIQSLLAC